MIGWTPEAIAVAISIFSLCVAALALGWNIYRDVVLKARLKVHLAVADLVIPGEGRQGTFLNISGTNFGPGDVNVGMICGHQASFLRRLFGKKGYFVVFTDGSNPLSTPLPRRIGVGEKVEFFLPYDRECFLKEPVTRIGLTDSFGRCHWVPRGDLKSARKQYAKDFVGQGCGTVSS